MAVVLDDRWEYVPRGVLRHMRPCGWLVLARASFRGCARSSSNMKISWSVGYRTKELCWMKIGCLEECEEICVRNCNDTKQIGKGENSYHVRVPY